VSTTVHPVRQETNGRAIAALVLGIAGLVIFPFVPSVLAVWLGITGRRQIRRDPTQTGEGLATAGLILGWIGVAMSTLAVLLIGLVFGLFAFSSVSSSVSEPGAVSFGGSAVTSSASPSSAALARPMNKCLRGAGATVTRAGKRSWHVSFPNGQTFGWRPAATASGVRTAPRSIGGTAGRAWTACLART
jgi:hypothetical protein